MRLLTKILCLFLLIGLIPVLLTGFFAYELSRKSLEKETLASLEAANSEKSARITTWITVVQQNVEYLAQLPILHDVLSPLNENGYQQSSVISLDSSRLALQYFQPMVQKGQLAELFMISPLEGRVVISSDARQVGKIKIGHQYFQEGKKRTYVENIYYSMTIMQPTMVIATPVIGGNNKLIGVLVARLNLQFLSEIIADSSKTTSYRDTYLVNSQNYFITEPKYGKNFALRKNVYTDGVKVGLQEESGTLRYLSYRDTMVLGAFHYLPELRSVCITEMDEDMYLAPARDLRRTILLVGVFIGIFALFIGWRSAEHILTPFKKLVAAVNRMEADHLEFSENITGGIEITQLSQAFRDMGTRLKGTLVSRDRLQQEVDIRRATEVQLQQALAQLHRSNKELEQFAYVASHDLQEPLRMVSSYVQLLAERYQDQLDEKAQKFIAYAVDGSVRMQQLIQDLLNFSRVNTRGGEFAPVDCNQLVRLVIVNLQTAIEEKHAVVTVDPLPTVNGDKTQIIQVLQNLLANAMKFCPAGETPVIHVSAIELDQFWQLSVQDNGIGIDEQYRDKIFVIFQRLHTREEYPGTGIGLAICKRIIERHGGEIWFKSAPGEGTTFYMTFPNRPVTT